MNESIYARAHEALKTIYGDDALFREGQYEAIEATLTNRRTLVVQKTGWGKSLVYFISAKLIDGITIIISPLLVLMENQREAADKMGLRCLVLNSTIKSKLDRSDILMRLKEGKCDIFFTTPETLYSKEVQELIPNLNIGLFVIDECHCISDWGHDFRLEYGSLSRVISMLPDNVGVLGTTATANDRVIDDLKKQFGDDVYVSRGPLTRETLHIDVLKLETTAERYAWIKENIINLPGSGIIYCLTRRDCDNLSKYLNHYDISARPYYSGLELEEVDPETGLTYNQTTEKLFMSNRIKAIVATIKLGMGYDKEDIGFVIHFQRPSSLVAYYQQIGRAGRKEGSEAYCFMMTGKEDREVNEYFINNAFPTEEQERDVIKALEEHPEGIRLTGLYKYSNISKKALDKTIMFLSNQGIIYRDDTKKYHRSLNPYTYKGDYYASVRNTKIQELEAVEGFTEEKGCLSKFVVNSLNDYTAAECGKCHNCIGGTVLDGLKMPSIDSVNIAQAWLNRIFIEISPRKRWPDKENPFDDSVTISNPNKAGIALAKYGDAGYGAMVAYDKYHANAYRDELIDKAVDIMTEYISADNRFVITSIPSGRNTNINLFAEEVARKLGIQYKEMLQVTGRGEQQKRMQNTYYQYQNAVEKLCLKNDAISPDNVILIDDVVDSKWTLTVAGALLIKAGAKSVIPFCLADSSEAES